MHGANNNPADLMPSKIPCPQKSPRHGVNNNPQDIVPTTIPKIWCQQQSQRHGANNNPSNYGVKNLSKQAYQNHNTEDMREFSHYHCMQRVKYISPKFHSYTTVSADEVKDIYNTVSW